MGFTKSYPTHTYCILNPKTKKIILTKDVTFLQKSYRDYSKVEKPVLVTTSYEGYNEEEELETVPVMDNYNNNYNIVSDSS